MGKVITKPFKAFATQGTLKKPSATKNKFPTAKKAVKAPYNTK